MTASNSQMAELLFAKGYTPPDLFAMQLRAELPDAYFVIVGAMIHRRVFDAVIVAGAGLLVLHTRDWSGDVCPAVEGPWAIVSQTGRTVSLPNPAPDIREHNHALAAFLADEFPTLRPEVRHLIILTNPSARLTTTEAVWPPVAELAEMTVSVLQARWEGTGQRLSGALCAALALALKERRLTRSQRSDAPFTFRSGGRFGGGRQVWTLQDAVRHMDRFPDDGIFHLRDGTLVRWFEEQGAEHIARLARECLRSATSDYRETLETFLINTGLVGRPSVSIRPQAVDMGAIISGEVGSVPLHIQRGKGRGYLFGVVRSEQPWLRIKPDKLSNGELDAVVTVDTRSLPIRREPYTARIELSSSASSEPRGISVRFRVTGLPAAWQTWLVRPSLHGLVAGMLGIFIGWLLEGTGIVVVQEMLPKELVSFADVISRKGAWVSFTGATWATFGVVHGLRTRRSKSLADSLGRWTFGLLFWSVFLFVIGRIALAAWWGFVSQAGAHIETGEGELVLAVLIIAAVVPAAWSELPFVRETGRTPAERSHHRRVRRRFFLATGLVLLFVAVLAGLGPNRVSVAATRARYWASEGMAKVEQQVNALVDDLLLRYYDRRAPAQPKPDTLASPLATPLKTTPAATTFVLEERSESP